MAATIDCRVRGTFTSTFRMKCTRQRCHDAPGKTSATAALSPRYESLITSCTPESPRSRRLWRNSVQKAASSESPMAMARISRLASWATPVATTTATTRPDPGLNVGDVTAQIGKAQVGRGP